MKKIFLILILMAHLTGCTISKTENSAKLGEVQIGNQSWQVEIADDNFSRQYGLMFREKLDENMGMIFVFEESGAHSFWMKNTLIPLDLVWISADKKVVEFTTLHPCQKDPCPSYTPTAKAKYVLEINAGKFRGNLGDEVKINL